MSLYSIAQSLEATLLGAAVLYLETNKERLSGVSPETLEVVEALALKHHHRAVVEYCVEAQRQQNRVKVATRRDERMTKVIDLKMSGADQAAIDAELASVDADDAVLAKLDAKAPERRTGMTRGSVLGGVE